MKRLEDLEKMTQVRFNAEQVTVESLAAISGQLALARLSMDFLEEILGEKGQ